jgi:hypothetical protein
VTKCDLLGNANAVDVNLAVQMSAALSTFRKGGQHGLEVLTCKSIAQRVGILPDCIVDQHVAINALVQLSRDISWIVLEDLGSLLPFGDGSIHLSFRNSEYVGQDDSSSFFLKLLLKGHLRVEIVESGHFGGLRWIRRRSLLRRKIC